MIAITVKFADDLADAYITSVDPPTKTVIINAQAWHKMSQPKQFSVLSHELAHIAYSIVYDVDRSA